MKDKKTVLGIFDSMHEDSDEAVFPGKDKGIELIKAKEGKDGKQSTSQDDISDQTVDLDRLWSI